jgi:hypothetical protein
MSDDKGNYTKVEREILELLDEIEEQQDKPAPSNIVKFRRPAKRRVPRFSLPNFSEIRYALSPGKLLIVILVAILGAVFLQDVPFASPLLILIAAVAFVAVFFARSRPSTGAPSSKGSGIKRWRGRDIDLTRRG